MKRTLLAFSTLIVLATSGCVYRMEMPQGAPITAINKIERGMTAAQVIAHLGSPQIFDPTQPDRFTYVYHYRAGTEGRKLGKSNTNAKVVIVFKDGLVADIIQ